MNQFNNMQDDEIKDLLTKTADQINPDPVFTGELERQLKVAHKPSKGIILPSAVSLFRTLGWATLVIALAFGLNWILRDLIPQATPGNGGYLCPVTEPNGSLPPGETVESQYYLGNGQLWTSLWPDGKVYMSLENRESDGSFSMKWGWVRGLTGPLTIEGHRLDAQADPLRSDIPDGYGDTGFQVSALIFPTTGCWEVTGYVGDASLTFVTEVLFDGATPTPNVQSDQTPDTSTFDYTVQNGDTCGQLADRYSTTIEELLAANGLQECNIFMGQVLKIPVKVSAAPPTGEAYDWGEQTVYRNAPFPETPSSTNIYRVRDEMPASVEDVTALASQFGLSGDIYQTTGELAGTTDYLVVSGNQQLHVRSDRYFTYYADYVDWSTNSHSPVQNPNADAVIHEFLQAHGFGSEYEIEYSEQVDGYVALPRTPDGLPIRHEQFTPNAFIINFNKNGIMRLDARLMKYDEVIPAGVITAQEAFDRFLDPNSSYGSLQGIQSPPEQGQTWLRARPLDETITIFGWLHSTSRSLSGGAPFITLDGYSVTGNTVDIPENLPNTFVEATGQFHETDGLRSFQMETWKRYEGYEEGQRGNIKSEGDRIILTTTEGTRLILPEFPADITLPAEDLFVTGVTRGDVFEWKSIDTRKGSGGGGGGGGAGFYKLNVTGTPVPPFTPQPISTIEPPFDSTIIEGLNGTLMVTIIKYADGTQRTEYGLIGKDKNGNQIFLNLQGDQLDALLPYNNRPVRVWGTMDTSTDGYNLQLDRFEIPYPDLQFQILKGTQKWAEIQGQEVLILTTEAGESYIQLTSSGDIDYSLIGAEGDPVAIEALKLPDENFGDMPAIRVFSLGMTGNGIPELTITADQPNSFDENQPSAFTRPTLTIDKIELDYFTPDQRYSAGNSSGEPAYLQPAWRFSGHYNTGDEFEVFIQALKDEFLLPDIQQLGGPG